MGGLFQGIYTALITPFNEIGDIDEKAYAHLIEQQIEAGIHGLVPCGTTGETPTLSPKEQIQVIQTCIRQVKGRVPIIAGGSRNATAEACDFHRQLAELGVDASLQSTPWYNKPTQQGLYLHFRAIAESAPLPVVLYNVPARTGVSLNPETTLRLALDCPNIIGIKEASGSVANSQKILAGLRTIRDDFSVLSGEDDFILPLLGIGGQGVISVISHLAAKEMVAMYDAFKRQDLQTAQKISAQLSDLVPLMFQYSNPIPVKTAVAAQGIVKEVFRLPLCPLSANDKEHLMAALKKLSWLKMETL
jgi:4-hydroxy-tetrahydrodipicolinate synthase